MLHFKENQFNERDLKLTVTSEDIVYLKKACSDAIFHANGWDPERLHLIIQDLTYSRDTAKSLDKQIDKCYEILKEDKEKREPSFMPMKTFLFNLTQIQRHAI